MRMPLATEFKTRPNDNDRDARVKNGYVDVNGEQAAVRVRPGVIDDVTLDGNYFDDALAQLLFDFDGEAVVIFGDTLSTYRLSGSDLINVFAAEYMNNTWSMGVPAGVGDEARYEGTNYIAVQPDSGDHTPGGASNPYWVEGKMPTITGTVSNVTNGSSSNNTFYTYYNGSNQYILTSITVTTRVVTTSNGTYSVPSINVDRSTGSSYPNWPSGTVPGFATTIVNNAQTEAWVAANSGTYGISYSSGSGYYRVTGSVSYTAVGNGTIDWAFTAGSWGSTGTSLSTG